MSGNLLLDTSAVIALLRNDAAAKSIIGGNALAISSTVGGELYYGAFNSNSPAENLLVVQNFIASIVLLPCDEQTGRHYGEIKATLRKVGKLIPENDIWVAATAMQHNLVVLTRDVHFQSVTGIRTLTW